MKTDDDVTHRGEKCEPDGGDGRYYSCGREKVYDDRENIRAWQLGQNVPVCISKTQDLCKSSKATADRKTQSADHNLKNLSNATCISTGSFINIDNFRDKQSN